MLGRFFIFAAMALQLPLFSDCCPVAEQNVHCTWQGKVAPHLDNRSWTLHADFLYWQAKEDGLEFATRFVTTSSNPFIIDADVKHPDFEWKPGVEVGVGYIFGCQDHWDFNLDYTYYHGKADGSTSFTGPLAEGGLLLGWFPFLLGPFGREARANWGLNFHVLDGTLGRDYFISEKISLHPFLGARGAWIYQDYTVDYRGDFRFTSGGVASFLEADTKFIAHNNFVSGGVVGGADFLWHFNPHWGLCGGLAASVLYGNFDVKETIDGFNVVLSGGQPALSFERNVISNKFLRTRCNVEAYLGFEWEGIVNCYGHHLSISLLYDLSHWFDQNELQQLVDNATVRSLDEVFTADNRMINQISQRGNLSLQGGRFSLAYAF